MEAFTTRYRAQVSADEENWVPISYITEQTCRDSAIYSFSCNGDQKAYPQKYDGSRGHYIKDIEIAIRLQNRVSDSYPIFKELAEVFKIQIVFEDIKNEFSDRTYRYIKLFGNDATAFMAWYWVVLAMRRGIVNQEGDFHTRMRETKSWDESTWDCEEDYEDSLRIWKKWVHEGIGPTSHQMINDAVCPINWYYNQEH